MNPALPETMAAVLLTGHGGFDKLEYCMDVAVPAPGADQVLIRVLAAGVNNTDINTRIGWYSKGVESATDVGGGAGFSSANASDASWSGAPLPFPRIQGADVCGRIVAVGAGVDPARIGERVLVAPIQRAPDGSFEGWMGSECDGGFAQYTLAYSAGAYRVTDALSDTELASFPCAYSTAENLLHRAGVTARDTVLITGASGGVGSAAVQLAKRRGAAVLAVAGVTKMAGVNVLGADQVIARGENLINILGRDAVNIVIDLVAGPQWPQLLDILRPGGRYATSGAIAGPLVTLDVRTLYLKDLTLLGCTRQEPVVFENLTGYISRGEIQPVVAGTYPLQDIVKAQQDFLAKTFTGKLVLIPP